MPLAPLLWALCAVPVWLLVAQAPAAIAGPDGPIGPLLVVGFVVATALTWRLDRRFGPPGPPRYGLPDRPVWLVYALIAGLGFTVLASELGNVGAHLADVPLRDPETTSPPPLTEGWRALVALALHAGLLLVAVGVSGRALLAMHRPWTAIILTALIGAIFAPFHLWPQFALLMGLPAWLFAHTRSLGLAAAGYLPFVLLPLLPLVGLEIGVQGFDTFAHGPEPFQPVWFNLVGAALVAAGVAPLIAAFEREARESDVPDPGGEVE